MGAWTTGLIGKIKERTPRFLGDLLRDLLAEIIREENTFDLTLPRLVFAARSHHLVSSQFSPPGSTSVHTQKTIVFCVHWTAWGLLAG
jgi:hypothetical protein